MMKTVKHFRVHKNRQSGLSLIEVLMAVVITAIGLLGLAGMQATGLQSNHSAYHRSQATVLAYDIADRIRANVGNAANYLSSYTPVAPDPITVVRIIDGITITTTEYPPSEEELTDGCSTTAGCTGAQMAFAEKQAWTNAVAAALPSGTATITLNGGLYTVSIRWDDNRSGGIDANDPTFQMSFRLET